MPAMRYLPLFLVAFLGASPLAHAQPYNFQPVTDFVKTFVDPYEEDLPNGAILIVIQDGQPIYQRHFGRYVGIDPQIPIASASKWLSALVIQRLVKPGR